MADTGKKGKKIGKYSNAVLLAKGGMGEIYKADHPTLELPVVLKMLTLNKNEQFIKRFQQEAKIMMGFQHVNIVNYYDHFKTSRSYCMVMEYVDGCSVAQLLEKQRYLQEEVALIILRDTLRALSFAHKKGIIHRDIKSANILLSVKGDIKLTDFGIAYDQSLLSDGLTRQGMTLGTPAYMAPEQFRDPHSVDQRADIYSAGILLYEMLSGLKPFSASSVPELLEKIKKNKFLNLKKNNPNISSLSCRIIKYSLKYKPERRFRDVEKILKLLDKYFARRNESQIYSILANLITGKEILETVSGRRFYNIKKRFFITLNIILISAAAVVLWWSLSVRGFMPAVFLPRNIGSVSLEVGYPGDHEFPPEVSMVIYRIENNFTARIIKKRRGHKPFFKLNKNEEETENGKIVIFPVIVKSGLYRFDIIIGNKKITKITRVQSLKDNYLSFGVRKNTYNGKLISINWKPSFRNIVVKFNAKKAETGLPVPALNVYYREKGSEDFIRIFSDSLWLDGSKQYEFKFTSPEYREQIVALLPVPGINDYSIQTNMYIKPAELTIETAEKFCRIYFDGGKYFKNAEKEGGFRRVPFLWNKPVTFYLYPGQYVLSAGTGKSYGFLNVKLKAGEKIYLKVYRNGSKKYIWEQIR